MDKIKKYLKENEEHLSVEKISDDVWLNVHQAIKPKRSFLSAIIVPFLTAKNFFTKKEIGGSGLLLPNYNRWAFAILLPALFIFSCTYRVNRIEVIGDIISFNIHGINNSAVQKITMLQGLYSFKALEYKNPLEDGLLSFISFVERKAKKSDAISTGLKEVPTISQLEVTPVSAKINESLLSAFVHKAFNVHVDARRSDNKEVERNILFQLKKKGFDEIKVQIDTKGEVQLISDNSLPVLADEKVEVKSDSSNIAPDKKPVDISSKVIKEDTVETNIITKETAGPEPREESKATLSSRDTLPGKGDEEWLVNTSLKPGTWRGFLTESKIKIYLKDPNYDEKQHQGWALTRSFTYDEAGIERARRTSEFQVKREAGTLTFKGSFIETRGEGTFEFQENAKLKSYLQENGLANVTEDLMLLFFLSNIDKQFFDYVKSNGYANISSEQLRRLATHSVTLDYLKEFLPLLKEHNYKDVSLEQLVNLKDHKVNAAFLKSLIQLGYKDIPLKTLQSLKDHGVTAAFIQQFRDIGYQDISLDQAQNLKIHRVTAAFIQSFIELGYQNIPLNQAQSLKVHYVTAPLIQSFIALGYQNIPLNRVQSLKIHGVTAAYIKGFRDLGFTNLTLDKAEQLKIRGLTPAFVKEMKEKGRDNLTLDEYLRLK